MFWLYFFLSENLNLPSFLYHNKKLDEFSYKFQAHSENLIYFSTSHLYTTNMVESSLQNTMYIKL
jgi:hypothetical protein